MARKTIPEDAILMKGTLDGLRIVLDDSHKFLPVFETLEKKIKTSKAFFSGNRITLMLKNRPMTQDEYDYSRTHLLFKYGIEIEPATELEKPQTETLVQQSRADSPNLLSPKIVTHTLRAGQMIGYEGDMIILGDVNPGAEVTASGSVYIFGALRGRIWAGAKGDRNASIIALDFEPVQMRIADKVVVSPGRSLSKDHHPQKAFIEEESIVVINIK